MDSLADRVPLAFSNDYPLDFEADILIEDSIEHRSVLVSEAYYVGNFRTRKQ